MTTQLKTGRTRKTPRAPAVAISGNISSHIGNMRSVTLGRRVIDADQLFGADANLPQSLGSISNDVELKGDIL